MKKIVSIMLLVVLALTLCVGALADVTDVAYGEQKKVASQQSVIANQPETGKYCAAIIANGYKFEYPVLQADGSVVYFECYSYDNKNFVLFEDGTVYEILATINCYEPWAYAAVAETGKYAKAIIEDGTQFTVGKHTFYSYDNKNFEFVNGAVYQVFGVTAAGAAKNVSSNPAGTTSLKTGAALVAILALSACCAGGVAVVTGKKA